MLKVGSKDQIFTLIEDLFHTDIQPSRKNGDGTCPFYASWKTTGPSKPLSLHLPALILTKISLDLLDFSVLYRGSHQSISEKNGDNEEKKKTTTNNGSTVAPPVGGTSCSYFQKEFTQTKCCGRFSKRGFMAV